MKLLFVFQIVNAFILLLLGVPTMLLLVYELRLEYCDAVVRLGHRTIVLWVLAVICWVTDRVFCSWCATIGFPYLHAAWHLLIFLASYPACVLFAYFQAKKNSGGPVPILRYSLVCLQSIYSFLIQILSMEQFPAWGAFCRA